MATRNTSHSDIERLNAFVDGELTPAERAEIAAQIRAQPRLARAHATLAHLKASIGETVDATPPMHIDLPATRLRGARLVAGVAGLASLAFGVLALVSAARVHHEYRAVPIDGQEAVVTLAALPSRPAIPRLDSAGLILTDIKLERAGDVRLLVASYRGRHGCRLDMWMSPAGSVVPTRTGTSHHRWIVGPLTYELVAHGMPDWRFAIIADAAERQSRDGGASDPAQHRLREAHAHAPCTS